MANVKEKDPTLKINTNAWQPKWLTIPRIFLGLLLIWKGVSFFKDTTQLSNMFQYTNLGIFNSNEETWAFIITYAHILTGFFIAIGLFTRWSCVAILPFILGALFFVNIKSGMALGGLEFILSLIAFLLAIGFAWKGSGAISADEYFRNYTKAGIEPGHTEEFLN